MTTATSFNLTSSPLSMSSREIAGLTGKEHKHVRRDIMNMLNALNLSSEGYAQPWTDPQNGQSYTEFLLPKDLTITLIAGYRADLRLKIVRRWMELEGASASTPRFNVPSNFREALLLAADQQGTIDDLQVELNNKQTTINLLREQVGELEKSQQVLSQVRELVGVPIPQASLSAPLAPVVTDAPTPWAMPREKVTLAVKTVEDLKMYIDLVYGTGRGAKAWRKGPSLS